MSHQAQPSEANRSLNVEIEKKLQADKQQDPSQDQSKTFVFESGNGHRGEQNTSRSRGKPRGRNNLKFLAACPNMQY